MGQEIKGPDWNWRGFVSFSWMSAPVGAFVVVLRNAPKGNVTGGIKYITATELSQVANNKMHIYLWGEVTYFDGFPGTERHTTQFCQATGGVGGSGTQTFSA